MDVFFLERLEKNHAIALEENARSLVRIEDLERKLGKSISLGDVQTVVRLVAQESIASLADKPNSPYIIKSDTEAKGDTVTVNFYFEHKVKFAQYDYQIEDAIESSRFVEAASVFALSLNKIYKGQVTASSVIFEGSADTILGSKKVDAYGGVFGEIDEEVLLNGKKKNVTLHPGQLRSYAIYRSQ